MAETDSFYSLLEIDEGASADKIKKAYFTAVRRFPPERFPDEFKKIREAYDTLSNPESRREYDEMLHTGTRYEEPFNIGRKAFEDGDYETAYRQFEIARKLVVKRHSVIENLMGLTCMEREEYKKATDIFRDLTEAFPENSVFHSNLGYSYFKRGMYVQAVKAMEEALRYDRSNVENWLALSYCRFKMREFDRSRAALKEGIRHCGENVSFYLKLLELDAAEGNAGAFQEDLEQLVGLVGKDKEMKENVTWSLTEIAQFLIDERKPDYAAKIFEKLRKLNPGKKAIREMYEEASRLEGLHAEFERLKSDMAVHKMLLEYIEGKIYFDGYESDDDSLDVMRRLILMQPAALIPSIRYIKSRFPLIYEADRDFFETTLANPKGVKGDEKKLLKDLKRLAAMDGEDVEDIQSLEDFYIPEMPVVKPDRVGRNDPCPCGSGKKYKKCCLGK